MLNLRPARNAQRSIASLDAYRAAEAARAASKAGGDAPAEPVAVGRTLSHSASFDVEYEALALRVAPPEITVDNRSRADATLITVDSANRAGTLLAVAQFLTQKRLNVKSARITSDFGWFYDVFEVTEADGGKVTDEAKLDDIRRMLDVDVDAGGDVAVNSDETDDARRVESTVVQVAGPDRPGLLADVTALLARRGCDVRSAAVWTHGARVACVLSVTEKGRPVTDAARLAQLVQLLEGVVNDGGADDGGGPPPRPGAVTIDRVRGEVHHDRRLHRLLLAEAAAAWAEARAARNAGGGAVEPGSPADSASSLDGAPGPTPLDAVHLHGVDDDDGGNGACYYGGDAEDDDADDDAADIGRDAARPAVRVAHDARANYWVVTTVCADRPKLLFDTLCTLADLDYDVYHASVDAGGGGVGGNTTTTTIAAQEFFVRPRHGGDAFDPDRADQLAALVGASIVRRFPRGLKVHVRSLDRYGCLASLTAVLRASGLTVTRAKVRTYGGGAAAAAAGAGAVPGSGHTFYVMGAGGAPPDRAAVEAACAAAGGQLVDPGDEAAAAASSVRGGTALRGATPGAPPSSAGSPAAFSFSFRKHSVPRRWAGWRARAAGAAGATGASPGSDASSF